MMTARRAIALAGLAVGLAILTPASALADTGGTDRPVKGPTSGTASLNLLTGAIATDLHGVTTHIGKYTAHSEGIGVPNPADGTFVSSGTTTIVAANGDQLTGTFTGIAYDTPAGAHLARAVTTITGGTGRFADATGTLTTNLTRVSLSFVGDTVVNSDVGTTTGELSY